MTPLSRTRNGDRSQTALFDEAESDCYHGLAAAGAFSVLLVVALAILERIQNEEQSPFENRDSGGKLKERLRLMASMTKRLATFSWKEVGEIVTSWVGEERG